MTDSTKSIKLVPKRITVKYTEAGGIVDEETMAFCHESFAAHLTNGTPGLKDGWRVTHIPTSRSLGHTIRSQEECKKIIAVLLEWVEIFNDDQPSRIVNSCPKWIGPWLEKCTEYGRCLDTTPFQEAYGTEKKGDKPLKKVEVKLPSEEPSKKE